MINSKNVNNIQSGQIPTNNNTPIKAKKIKKYNNNDGPKVKNKSVKLSKILSGHAEIKDKKKSNNKNKVKFKVNINEDIEEGEPINNNEDEDKGNILKEDDIFSMAYDQYYNNKINGEIKEADINMIKHLKKNKEAIKTHILKHKDKIKNNDYKGGKGHQNKIVKEFGNYYNNNKDTIQNKSTFVNKESDNKTIQKYELDKSEIQEIKQDTSKKGVPIYQKFADEEQKKKEIDDYKDKREELRNKYKEPTKEQLKDKEFKIQYKNQLKNQEYLKERDKINSLNDEELTKYIKDKEQTNNKYPSISDKSSEEDVFNLLPSKKKNYRSLDSDNSGYESTKSEYKRENYKLKNDLSRLSNDLYEKKLIIDNKEIIIKEVLQESDQIMNEKLQIENLYKLSFANGFNNFIDKEKKIIELDTKTKKLEKEIETLNYYKTVIEANIGAYITNIGIQDTENKRLKDEMKFSQDLEYVNQLKKELLENKERKQLFEVELFKLKTENKNIRNETNKQQMKQSADLAVYEDKIRMNEQYIKKYEEKAKKFEDIETKNKHYIDIINELQYKNNQYEENITFLRNTIGSLQNDNVKLYNENNKLELEQKLEIVSKKLEQEEQNNIDMHTTNENIKQELLIYMEKCGDIPYLQNQINELLTKNDHLSIINDKESKRYEDLEKEFKKKYRELENNIFNIRKVIIEKINGDNLFHINNEELRKFIIFVNDLFNNPNLNTEFYTFPSNVSIKSDKSAQSELNIKDANFLLNSNISNQQSISPKKEESPIKQDSSKKEENKQPIYSPIQMESQIKQKTNNEVEREEKINNILKNYDRHELSNLLVLFGKAKSKNSDSLEYRKTQAINYLIDNPNINIDKINNAQANYGWGNHKEIQKELGIIIDDKDEIGKKRKTSKKK